MAKRSVAELSAAEKSEIAEWYEAGVKTGEISDAFNVSTSVPTLVAREMGLPGRQDRGDKRREPTDPASAELPVTEYEGLPFTLDTDLGKALGYKDPRDVRRIIKTKLLARKEFGPSWFRSAMVEIGSGAHRQTTEYLLTQEQANLVILHCRLPNADAFKALVAKVFTAWQQGRLTSTDAETTIELQDAAEEAHRGSPELSAVMNMLVALNSKVDALAQKAETVVTLNGRLNIKPADTRIIRKVELECFGGKCPLTGIRIIDDSGNAMSNGIMTIADYDHFQNAGLPDAHNCWFIERGAHKRLTDVRRKPVPSHDDLLFLERARSAFAWYQTNVYAHHRSGGVQMKLL